MIPGSEIIENGMSIIELLMRFLANLASIFILVRLIYYPVHKQKDYLFTFFLFNLVIFMICVLLSGAMMKMGFAFGLFAIFSMIRYRTVSIPVKEMGYFFVSVTMGMINALATTNYSYAILGVANVVILATVLLLDQFVALKHENKKEIIYDKIDLITPENRALLIADIKQRTGIAAHRVDVVNINFLRDVALIQVFYYDINVSSTDQRLGFGE